MLASGVDWDLSGSGLSFSLGLDGVLNFIVQDLNISEELLSGVLNMSVFGGWLVAILDGNGVDSAEKSNDLLH